MRLRLLIADLMAVVVPCAVAAYAYRTDPALLADVAFAVFLAAVCLASLGAKFRRGNRKAKMFSKGFALFGWLYLVLGLWLGFEEGRRLTHSVLGLGFAFICGYATRRLVTREPAPG